jgi:hypothetical protein
LLAMSQRNLRRSGDVWHSGAVFQANAIKQKTGRMC